MFKSLLIFPTILIAQGTSAQERVWPDVKMSCPDFVPWWEEQSARARAYCIHLPEAQ